MISRIVISSMLKIFLRMPPLKKLFVLPMVFSL